MLYDSTSSEDESSESEDDLELLLLDAMLTPKRRLSPRINLQDIDEFQCEQWFRYAVYVMTTVAKRKTTQMGQFSFCMLHEREPKFMLC